MPQPLGPSSATGPGGDGQVDAAQHRGRAERLREARDEERLSGRRTALRSARRRVGEVRHSGDLPPPGPSGMGESPRSRVRPGAAAQQVPAEPADQTVLAPASEQAIPAATAQQPVVARLAAQGCPADAAPERVAPPPPQMRSSPARLLIVSFPPSPAITSRRRVPVSLFTLRAPTMVAHAEGSGPPATRRSARSAAAESPVAEGKEEDRGRGVPSSPNFVAQVGDEDVTATVHRALSAIWNWPSPRPIERIRHEHAGGREPLDPVVARVGDDVAARLDGDAFGKDELAVARPGRAELHCVNTPPRA